MILSLYVGKVNLQADRQKEQANSAAGEPSSLSLNGKNRRWCSL